MMDYVMITSEMGCDVIPLSTGSTAIFPFASEAKIVGALATDMFVAEVNVQELGIG
jgi:hypothetical protein